MLQSIRSEGAKPPFFMVHGLHGTMGIGRALGQALDRDRPLYALHARGINSSEPPHERMEDMLGTYLDEIRTARPRGPYIIGGVCWGGLIAMELAQRLAVAGERVGRVILIDPPLIPFPHPANRNLDPKSDRRVHQQLYMSVEQILSIFANRFGDLPFDPSDPLQLHRAIEVGVSMLVMFGRYMPPPFSGATELIISADRALAHFHPEAPWKKVVANPRVHVVPGNHEDLFYSHLEEVFRLLGHALDLAFHA